MTLKYQAKPRTIAWKLGSASFCFANNIIGLKAVNSLRYIPDVMKTGSANVNFFVWSEMLLKTNESQQGFLYFITGTASLLFLCSSLNLWPLMSQTVHSFFENSTALVSASFSFSLQGWSEKALPTPPYPMDGAGMASFPITARCGPSFTATEIWTRPLVRRVLIISLLMGKKGLVNFHVKWIETLKLLLWREGSVESEQQHNEDLRRIYICLDLWKRCGKINLAP